MPSRPSARPHRRPDAARARTGPRLGDLVRRRMAASVNAAEVADTLRVHVDTTRFHLQEPVGPGGLCVW